MTVGDRHVYAWNWFALHSAQRMQLVNFWLVSVAFLGAAFVQARVSNLPVVAVGVCVAGFLSSLAFLLLDRRTRELVHVAERALRQLEDEGTTDCPGTVALIRQADTKQAPHLGSYRVLIQGLQATIAVLFAAAGGYALFL